MGNLDYFAKQVGLIENSGRTTGGNKVSSAKGLYQFIDGSVVPAINRLEKYIGMQPWMEEAKKHKNANKLTRDQQTLMFLGDLLEKSGSDKLMKGVMAGDKNAMMNAYYKLHHTKPDAATIKRAYKYFQ